jgi:hypothetical protein
MTGCVWEGGLLASGTWAFAGFGMRQQHGSNLTPTLYWGMTTAAPAVSCWFALWKLNIDIQQESFSSEKSSEDTRGSHGAGACTHFQREQVLSWSSIPGQRPMAVEWPSVLQPSSCSALSDDLPHPSSLWGSFRYTGLYTSKKKVGGGNGGKCL